MKSLLRKLVKIIKTYVLRDPFHVSVRQWFKDDGDNTLRLNYDLDETSVVFDVGGFHGDFAHEIHQRYRSRIYVFEPVKAFYEIIVRRFKGNDSIQVFNFGLSDRDGQLDISLDSDGSSVHLQGSQKEKVTLKEVQEFIRKHEIPSIDLIKINIEGGEFQLLPALINSGFISRIKNIQVQFHQFIPNAAKRREEIRSQLARTHKISYEYYFVWENWTLK